ncbi:MAG: S8 family serine peptidase [Synechococcus sp. SB0675_bin_7]|nr:S8 family serine peptidase [Synechococcus sp. SB0675_bin_7]
MTNAKVAAKIQQLTAAAKAKVAKRIDSDLKRLSKKYNAKWPLEMVNTYEALANLELMLGTDEASTPGKGVTLGLIDTGIHPSHHAFQYTGSGTITQKFLLGATQEAVDQFSHGTAVASIAAGRYYGAYGADVKMFAIPLGSGSGPYIPITLQQLSSLDTSRSSLFNTVLGNNLDILNLSFGYRGGIEDYTEQELRDKYGEIIEVLAQADAPEKTILVWRRPFLSGVPAMTGREERLPNHPPLQSLPVLLQELVRCEATPSQS